MHGPVCVHNPFHFAHADGTPFLPFGTTCCAWTHQPLAMHAQTLQTLGQAHFNKLRMGVFPKDYIYNANEPRHPMFEIGADGKQDLDRPNVAAFRHLDQQVRGAEVQAAAATKLAPFVEAVQQALLADARRPRRERRTAKASTRRRIKAREQACGARPAEEG